VKQLCQEAFSYAGLDWEKYVEVDPQYFRPTEVDYLLGDPSKARKAFGWKPKTSFEQLVRMMVDSDMHLAESERLLQQQQPAPLQAK
jgi:GDPmannose 4,6-dehydratase